MQSYKTIFNEKVINSDFDVYKGQNYPKSEEIWSLDSGYTSEDENKIPYRSSLGKLFHFHLGLNVTDTDSLCIFLKNSYKFYFHMPNEIPTIFHESDFINFETRLTLQVTATVTKTDKMLKKYSPEKRRCYFENERELYFFKSYTKNHCNFECLANFTLRRCDCVPFHFPRSESTRICDLHQTRCYKNAFYSWPKFDEMSNSTALPCNCLPTCSNIEYRVKQKQVAEISENTSAILREYANEIRCGFYS
jgi:amiloride-sensitive sodium channel